MLNLLDCQSSPYFFTSGPADKGAREEAYRKNAALDDLLSAMQTIILVAEYKPED